MLFKNRRNKLTSKSQNESESSASTRSNSRTRSKPNEDAINEEQVNGAELASDRYFDSDDDAGDLNRSGRVPLEWYDDEEHVGYTVEGKKLIKELDSSEIGKLLFNSENPDAWRTIVDPRNNRMIRLTNEDLKIINRIRKGMYPLESYDQEELHVEFDNKDSIHPVSYEAPPKARFLPSKWEAQKIKRLVKLIKTGKIVINKDEEEKEVVEDIWKDAIYDVDPTTGKRGSKNEIRPPKMPLPTHAESYNPPEEYLLNEEETKEWLETAPEDRKMDYLPASHDSLRKVGVYENLIVERFRRCLQLYLCPRAIKLQMNVDPESLYPKLPNLNDLKPFPTVPSVEYIFNSHITRLAVDSTGRWLACLLKNDNICICDIMTGRAFHTIECFKLVFDILWHTKLPILIVAHGTNVTCIAIELTNQKDNLEAEEMKKLHLVQDNKPIYEKTLEYLKIKEATPNSAWEAFNAGSLVGLTINHSSNVRHLSIHQSGNYLAVSCPESKEGINQCIVHCIVKKSSMRVGNKISSNNIRLAMFHPTEPKLIIGFTKSIRMYNLKTVESKDNNKLSGDVKFSGLELPTVMDMDSKTSYLTIADESGKVSLYDPEIGSFPYKTFSFNNNEIVNLQFHKVLPLLLIAYKNGTVHCLHISVPEEGKDPWIVPLKEIKSKGNLTFAVWHHTEPWLYTSSDKIALMWT